MTELVDYVRKRVPSRCCRERCGKGKCKADLKEAPRPFVLIDMDCPALLEAPEGSSRCDFLFVGEGDGNAPGWAAALELKGRPKASKVRAQLQAGAQFAQEILPGDVEVRFRPILFYRGGLRGAEVKRMRSISIRFKCPKTGTVLEEKVILKNRGSRLEEVLR